VAPILFLQAPLVIGCDVTGISKEALGILANAEVIAINQGQKYRIRSQILSSEQKPFSHQLKRTNLAQTGSASRERK
jgi:hypothetical protein